METDRIEKNILLKTSLARAWHALSDSTEFGTWFGMRFTGPFAPGAVMRGVIVPTTVNAEVAKAQQPYEGIPFEITIEHMEPERLFSLRWHPGAVDPGIDYSLEPTSLVEFTLQEAAGGVLLTVIETGFDQIPLSRRAKAFASNDGGWTMAMTLIAEYVIREP
jgi:uncharacterized protein YndB with AHSA1/START domain